MKVKTLATAIALTVLLVVAVQAQPADSLFLMGGMHSVVWNDANRCVSYLPDMKAMGGNWAMIGGFAVGY